MTPRATSRILATLPNYYFPDRNENKELLKKLIAHFHKHQAWLDKPSDECIIQFAQQIDMPQEEALIFFSKHFKK